MPTTVQRINIYKYIKSGRLVAVRNCPRGQGLMAIDMSKNLRRIKKIRNVKYIKSEAVNRTDYILEARENVQEVGDGNFIFSYDIIRILSHNDLDENKWKHTKKLHELPVAPYYTITKEELIWAGERKGNVAAGIFLLGFTIGSWILFFRALSLDHDVWFF